MKNITIPVNFGLPYGLVDYLPLILLFLLQVFIY